MGKDISITDDHHCAVKERTNINVELANCDAEFEKGELRDTCYDSAVEVSQKRVEACKSRQP
jgi:hypothetical protein